MFALERAAVGIVAGGDWKGREADCGWTDVEVVDVVEEGGTPSKAWLGGGILI